MATAVLFTASPIHTTDTPKRHYKRIRVVHRHRIYGTRYSGEATYYSYGNCDSTGGGATTAAETQVHFGEVAQTTLAFGTKIELTPAIKGRRDFTVEDRFGSPQAPGRLDVWLPCSDSIPNPMETFRTYHERVEVFYRRVAVAKGG